MVDRQASSAARNRSAPPLPPPTVQHVYRRTGSFEFALVLVLAAVVFGIFASRGLL